MKRPMVFIIAVLGILLSAGIAVAGSGQPDAYPSNDGGSTFGRLPAEGTPLEVKDMPDLVAVVATNGHEGYAYKTELFGSDEPPATPEEAAATQQREPITINVYESDGKTVVGTFVVAVGVPLADRDAE